MFQEGKVKSYHDERGFGFIQIEGEKKDLFFHIKDFPNKNMPPKVGEQLKFRIVEDAGKFKADQIVRLDIEYQQATSNVIGQYDDVPMQASLGYGQAKTSTGSKIITIVGLIVILILIGLVYNKYQSYKVQKQQQVEQLMLQQQKIVEQQRATVGELKGQGLSEQGKKNFEKSINAPITAASPTSTSVSSPYRCDGRTHCSQMDLMMTLYSLFEIVQVHKWTGMADLANVNLIVKKSAIKALFLY